MRNWKILKSNKSTSEIVTMCHCEGVNGSERLSQSHIRWNMNEITTSCLHTPRNDKRGFTLAEVLITLAVVGVVAAMTLPSVINKINDHNFKVAYKKAYRDVNEAYRMMMSTDDEFEEIICPEGTCFNPAFGRNFKLLAKQFKAIKTCNKKIDCLKCDNKESHECSTDAGSGFIDSSGRVWVMYFDQENIFFVDTNGDKEPNIIGKDRWCFYLPTPRQSITNKNFIVPCFSNDISTKSMHCTSGNCKYKSWLIE